jgi:hypothetical protein
MGDEKDKGQGKPDAKADGKDGAKPGEKAEAQAPEVPPWLPLPKDFADFLECKRDSISLAGDGLKTGVDGVTAGFTEAKKKGHFKITIKGLKDKVPIELPDPLELDASVDKDGKLHIHVRDRKDIPQPIKDGIRDFVNQWNRFVNGKGSKLAPPEAKEGKLVLAKVKTTAALPDGKGFLPHVPTWEKAGAAVFVAASVAFGVGFMNAGDETKTASTAGGEQAATNNTPNLYKAVTSVRVIPPGRPPVDAAATSGTRVETVLPLFVKSPHRAELVNVQGRPVDSFVLPVPNEEGTVKGSTERGGTFDCFVNHRQGVNGSGSSGRCAVQPPSSNAVPATTAGSPKPAEVARTTETTEGKPWSLLAIPGILLFAGGGLVVDEERRKRQADVTDPKIDLVPDLPPSTYPYEDLGPPSQPEQQQDDDDDGDDDDGDDDGNGDDGNGDDGNGNGKTYVDTDVPQPDLPPAENLPKPGDPSPKPPPEVM